MKYRTTNKALRDGFRYLLRIGNGAARNLLHFEDPEAYTCGTYGWSADVYRISSSTAICTGYRAIGMDIDYELLREYEDAAEQIVYNGGSYDSRKALVQDLLHRFVNETIEREQGK